MQLNLAKSTRNVQPWQILTISLLLVSSLSGCASIGLPKIGGNVKPIEVVTKPLDKTPLNIKLPDPIKTNPLEWVVVTPDNAEQIFKQLEEKGQNKALFAITSDGYQTLAYTIADLRNLIATQRQIILKYKEYYEPQVETKTEDSKETKK